MRRYDQRLYRAARAIVRDDEQDAYTRAYEHLSEFAGRARFSTWLTRIAVHEALARTRRAGQLVQIEDTIPTLSSPVRGPEQHLSDCGLAAALEVAIDALPDVYRSVFMLRDVEGLSTRRPRPAWRSPSRPRKRACTGPVPCCGIASSRALGPPFPAPSGSQGRAAMRSWQRCWPESRRADSQYSQLTVQARNNSFQAQGGVP